MSGHLNYVCGAPSSSRRLCFMGVAVLLGFAVLSPAADLPRTGTFSGVYHRDRWGVGRFHFYLVSPETEKTKGTQLVSRKQTGGSSFRETSCVPFVTPDYREWWSQISIVVNANGLITRTGAPHASDIEPTPVFKQLGPPFAN